MPAHSPIGSCCSRPKFNAVGGVDLPLPRWTPWPTRISANHETADDTLADRASKAGCAVRWFAAMLLRRGSP